MPTWMECGWNRQRHAKLVLWRGWQHRDVTGPQPSAVELHGYISYIVMCAVTGREYTIYGYKGKRSALCGAREHRRQAGHSIESASAKHHSTPSELRRFWVYFLVLFS
jgi:hypothetical protein